MAAIYTFFDKLAEKQETKELSSLGVALALARGDIQFGLADEPMEIRHAGITYTRADIMLLTSYRAKSGIRVHLPAA